MKLKKNQKQENIKLKKPQQIFQFKLEKERGLFDVYETNQDGGIRVADGPSTNYGKPREQFSLVVSCIAVQRTAEQVEHLPTFKSVIEGTHEAFKLKVA